MIRASIAVFICVAIFQANLAAQEKVLPFALGITSKMTIEEGTKKQQIDASTQLAYRWSQKGNERVLRFDSTQVLLQFDGKPTMDTLMSRSKLVNGVGDQKKETLFANCTAEQQKILKDSFDAPLCKLTIDANGTESKREVVAAEGAKAQIENGMITNGVLFHAPFVNDKQDWTAEREISMGNGGFAKGTLTYTRTEKDSPKVTVAGKLSNAKHKLPNSPISIVDANYVITGEQTYDSQVGDWIAGKLNIEISFNILNEDKKIGSATGTMTQTLEHKPAK